MTAKERVLRVIQALPADATVADAIMELRRLERGDVTPGPGSGIGTTDTVPDGEGDAFDLLRGLAGVLHAPADWAREHDHYLYGTPKRSDVP